MDGGGGGSPLWHYGGRRDLYIILLRSEGMLKWTPAVHWLQLIPLHHVMYVTLFLIGIIASSSSTVVEILITAAVVSLSFLQSRLFLISHTRFREISFQWHRWRRPRSIPRKITKHWGKLIFLAFLLFIFCFHFLCFCLLHPILVHYLFVS